MAYSMIKKSEAMRAFRERAVPMRSPSCATDLDGSDYKLRCPQGECHEKYDLLRQ